jgi:hypothetical protein
VLRQLCHHLPPDFPWMMAWLTEKNYVLLRVESTGEQATISILEVIKSQSWIEVEPVSENGEGNFVIGVLKQESLETK